MNSYIDIEKNTCRADSENGQQFSSSMHVQSDERNQDTKSKPARLCFIDETVESGK